MEVGVKVMTENMEEPTSVRHANSCFFTMVAVNADRQSPPPVPGFRPSTADEVRRFQGAKLRRELRRELEARYKAIHDPYQGRASTSETPPAAA